MCVKIFNTSFVYIRNMAILKFAVNFKNLLKSNGYSHDRFAKIIGTTQQTVSRWASGENTPDIETIAKIAIILGEDLNTLCGFDSISESVKNEIRNKIN